MKKLIILIVVMLFVFSVPVFACSQPKCNHNNTAIGHGGNANAVANGGNVNSKIHNTNRNNNEVIGINKNSNTNKNSNKNDNTNILNNRNTNNNQDVNNNSNTQGQDQNQGQLQGQLQGQMQGQSANNTQGQSANNSQGQDAHNAQGQSTDVNIDGDEYEDNSVYMAPPSTTAVVGTTSAQVTTPFGGAGFSKDAQYMIYKYKMDETEVAYKRGYISEEERVKKGKYLYKKFIGANKKGIISNIVDPLF